MSGRLSRRVRSALAILSLALSTAMAWSQQPPAPEPSSAALDATEPATPFRLHVYANLVQVPTLVLSSREKLPPPIAREKFDISLDSGRIFHPTQMRMQGTDPIALGILLDAGGTQNKLLVKAADALSQFAGKQLGSSDSVTLYAVDCKIMRSLVNGHPDPVLVKRGIESLLAAPGLHGEKKKPACANELHLWDAIVYTANALGNLPGRRVLLVVSTGNEAKSQIRLQAASEFLTNKAIALFGVRDPDEMPLNTTALSMSTRGGNSYAVGSSSGSSIEDPFELLCAQNGGVVLKVSAEELSKKLDDFMGLLRGRYILEFPRPDGGEPGLHQINITVAGKKNYLIHSAGVTITMPDAAVANDPNTLHSQPSPATFGPRKVLSPSKH